MGWFIFLGGALVAVAISMFVPVLNVAIGPSTNTIMMCKEIERAGYLDDRCFTFNEHGPGDIWLKDRTCRFPKEFNK